VAKQYCALENNAIVIFWSLSAEEWVGRGDYLLNRVRDLSALAVASAATDAAIEPSPPFPSDYSDVPVITLAFVEFSREVGDRCKDAAFDHVALILANQSST